VWSLFVRLLISPAVVCQRASAKAGRRQQLGWQRCRLMLRPEHSALGDGSAPLRFDAMKAAMEEAFGQPMTTEGQGGSIPLCNVLADNYPDAEIMLLGVEEPKCLIHAPNESVDPSEIEHLAVAEALFLGHYPEATR
jgi:cysteinylglycine-S-conjugate dipeptidase